MNCGMAIPGAQDLPGPEHPSDGERATDYLRCLLSIGAACAADIGATQMSRDVAELIVARCRDVRLALVYRADKQGRRALLQASGGARGEGAGYAPAVELPQPFEWPGAGDDANQGDAPSCRSVLPLGTGHGQPAIGWLSVESEGPDSSVRAAFLDAAAQTLAIGLARMAKQDGTRRREEAVTHREQMASDFLGQISDEIRTLLTLLLGPLEAAVKRHNDNSLKAALRNGQRLKRLVDALLDFSHFDAGRIDPVLQPIDIAAMTEDVASLFHGAAMAAGIALTVDCPPLPQAMFVDRVQWEQVLINLIGNAIRFTASGEVRVSLRAHIGLMTLEVADTGKGIPPDDLAHVFDRLPRTRDRDERGFGLALVRELVRLHGGDIEASSWAGQGSRFRVCIPMLGKPARAVPHRHVTDLPLRASRRLPSDALGEPGTPTSLIVPASEAASTPTTQECIVVVIDHHALRDYVAGLLSATYRVHAMTDAADAVQALQHMSPDLILVDLGSTGAQGLDFIRRLRKTSHGAVLPTLLLSSATREFAHADAMAAGADDVVGKPFAASELLARVDAHMQLSRERRALHRQLTGHNRDLEAQVSLRTAALAASEAQFKAISNLVPDILWRADSQGRSEWRSEQWIRYTGDDGTGLGMEFVHPDDREATQAWLHDTIAGGPPSPHEYRIRRHDGVYHWFIARMSPLADANGVTECWFGSTTDIERQKLVRHALEAQVGERTAALASAIKLQQELLHRLSRSQEDERRRIARELHDSLGQYLAALKLVLSALAPVVVDMRVRELVTHLDALTTEVDREFDDIIAALRPVVLDELGLAGALPSIVSDWSRRSGVAAEVLLVQIGDERFDDEVESTLYRVAQESLTNIVKHAQARHVAVTLACRHGDLHLSIEDDGAGFDPSRHGGGWGLRGMAERARSIGGLLQVESSPGAGATILVRVPQVARAADASHGRWTVRRGSLPNGN